MSERAYNRMMKHFRMGTALFVKWLQKNEFCLWFSDGYDFARFNRDDTEEYFTFDQVYELYEQDEIKNGGLA